MLRPGVRIPSPPPEGQRRTVENTRRTGPAERQAGGSCFVLSRLAGLVRAFLAAVGAVGNAGGPPRGVEGGAGGLEGARVDLEEAACRHDVRLGRVRRGEWLPVDAGRTQLQHGE